MVFQPGQSGNPTGDVKRTRLWKEAIVRAVKRREETDPLALEKLADKLLSKVDEGDVSAMKEFGDRFDGRVAQAIIGGDEGDPAIQITEIRTIIFDPRNPEGESIHPALEPGAV